MCYTGRKPTPNVSPLFWRLSIAVLLVTVWAATSTGQRLQTTKDLTAGSEVSLEPTQQVDWPQLAYNNAHSGFNPSEKVLSPSTVRRLRERWTFTGGVILSSPAVVNGVVYVGSSDNHLYAVRASSGRLMWKTLLAGQGGINSSLAVANGNVYLGTGVDAGFFYAVNAATVRVTTIHENFCFRFVRKHVLNSKKRGAAASTRPVFLVANGTPMRNEIADKLLSHSLTRPP